MADLFAETDPLSPTNLEEIPLEEIPPVEHEFDPVVLPLLPPRRKSWKHHIQHVISKPSVKVFIGLVLFTALSFFPATLSNPRDLARIDTEFKTSDDVVLVLGNIFNFAWADTKTVSVQWVVYGWGKYRLQIPDTSSDDFLPVNRAVDVYLNNASAPAFSYDPELLPGTTDSTNSGGFVATTFRAEYNIEFCMPQYYAPNDCYSFSGFGFVIEKATNNSIPISLAVVDAGPGDFTTASNTHPSQNNFTRVVNGQLTPTTVQSNTIFPMIARSGRARALTYFLFAVNWLMALTSIVTTAYMFNQSGKEQQDSVSLLPIGVILTIPMIRALYVGSPPFGIFLDVVGLFPQMMSVSMCIVVVLIGFALQYRRGRGIGNKGARLSVQLNDLEA